MKSLVSIAALFAATMLSTGLHAQSSPTASKKDLAQRLIQLQQPEIDQLARSLAERPATQLMQSAAEYMQVKMAPEQRGAAQKRIEADVKKYVDDVTPLLRDRATKMAPAAMGAIYEEQFSEAELKELIAWFSSPTNHKFQQVGAEMQSAFVQKLIAESQPLTRPRLVALDGKIRVALGLPPELPAPDAAGASAPRASRPAASSAKATKQ